MRILVTPKQPAKDETKKENEVTSSSTTSSTSSGNYYSYQEGLNSAAVNINGKEVTKDNTTKNKEEGYNSGDEPQNKEKAQDNKRMLSAVSGQASEVESEESKRRRIESQNEREQQLLQEVQRKGFVIRPMLPDGNCLFRAIADQVYGDADMHDVTRKLAMDHIEKEKDHFADFVTEDINQYIARKRQDKIYGNNVEIQAATEIYSRPIEVYSAVSNEEPLNIFQNQYSKDNPPIRLSYHYGNHYNSIIDPNNPTFGAGLGLPDFQPGLADKTQMKKRFRNLIKKKLKRIY